MTLFYGNVGTVSLVTGQLADTYSVIASQPGVSFPSQINITDFSNDFFHTNVTVDSGSHLNLSMINDTDRTGLIESPVRWPKSGCFRFPSWKLEDECATDSAFQVQRRDGAGVPL
jgi:hypothetical protein